MKVKVYVSTDKIGSKCERIIEVEDDFNELHSSQQAEICEEALHEMINWGWEPA